MSELYKIFLRIKKHLHEKDYKKFDLPELVELILEDKTPQNNNKLISIYEYVEKMEKSLEDLGTSIINLNEFNEDTQINQIEIEVRNIILIVDQFIDGLAAILRVMNFKESKLKLKQSLAYLKSIRNIIIQKTNEFKLKISKTQLDTETFLRFLTDTIDIFLREAYIIRILKIKEVIKKTIDV